MGGADPEIIDAEWEEVGEVPRNSSQSLPSYLWAGVIKVVKHLLVAVGVVVVGLIGIGLLAGPASDTVVAPLDDDGALRGGDGDTTAPTQQVDHLLSEAEEGEWHPSLLCGDEQVLGEVVNTRREWLRRLLTIMANEGSYILPDSGNPIAEGAAHARMDFLSSPRFIEMEETGGTPDADAILIHCGGPLEVTGAFKLPDNSWSTVYLTLPESRFDIRAGSEGFSIELPEMERDLAGAVFNIAGVQLSLARFRNTAASNR